MTNKVTFKGAPVALSGQFPQVGEHAPAFNVVAADLSDISLSSLGAARKVLNIFPSIDTGVCATSVRKFNEIVSQLPNTVVLCVSADLPFAQSRFCAAEGLSNVKTGSTYRSDFLQTYGVLLAEGPLQGLAARAVVVLNEHNQVIHTELVSEIANEPNYDQVMQVLK